MAVTAIKIEGTIDLLKEARAKLYGGIFAHNNLQVEQCIDEIVKLGGDLNQPWSKPTDKYNCSNPPIVLCAFRHNTRAMQLLFNKGIDPNKSAKTPLMIDACRTGNEEVVSRVISAGGRINVQSSCDIQPIHAAMFSSIRFDYSVIFNSDWNSPAVKESLISWWEGGEFTPSTPLRARWPGSIPLVALLLKHRADPTVEESTGLSALKLVQDPSCATTRLSLFQLGEKVKFISSEDGILTFKITLKNRELARTLENIIVHFDVNMELPKDVRLSAAAEEVLSTVKTRTMRGLVEAYAPKNKSSHSDDDLLDIKRKVERIKISTLQYESDVRVIKEGFTQVQEQHVVVYQEYQERQAYQERLAAVKKDKGSPVYAFFNTVSKELDRLLTTYKLLMKDPKKFDKAEAASSVIGALANFAPAPFNVPGHAIAVLVKVYGQYKLDQEQSRVNDLLERDHGPMCDDLALKLTEHYQKQLIDMEFEGAKKLAKNAVGVIFALMCDSKKTIDPLDSSKAIQEQLFNAVITSDFFSRKLKEHLAPSKSRFILPSFRSKPTLPPAAPPRSASQPPGRRTDKQSEKSPQTSKSSSILSAFTRSKSPEPPPVASQPTRCKPPAPPTKVVQIVK